METTREQLSSWRHYEPRVGAHVGTHDQLEDHLELFIAGVPIDLVRIMATFVFLWLGAEPMLEKLNRIRTKYGLAE